MNREMPKMVKPRKRPDRVYIRFGRWSARSLNHSTGETEAGVSVYPATLDDDGIVHLDAGDWDLPISALQGRLVFVVTGRMVGRGSDGEPVLRGIKALAYPIAHKSMPCGLDERWE